ncbi:MAG: succinylglutamate desuccinylase/aspartoacylase family protein [Kiloniellaceae bacterium]
MPRRTERLALPAATPGTHREVILHRYGAPGARPKAYLQAALHADETPALLAAHHLIGLLDEADARGAVRGEVVVVPFANPIGLAQFVDGRHLGRYEIAAGANFNRDWPDLFTPVAEKVTGKLTDSPAENVALIRAAMVEAIETQRPTGQLDGLRLALARQAADADLVLDLHCDDEALMHMYLVPAHWPEARDIAAELGCRAVLLAENSGGHPFDEAFSTPWMRLAAKFPDHPIPAVCLSATVELRGMADVGDELARADAAALLRSLQRHGVLDGDPGPMPEPLCAATRLDACDRIKAPAPGVLAYAVDLGAWLRSGDVVAWLVDPAAENPAAARRAIRTGADGLVLSRRDRRFVLPGMTVAKIVGSKPLPGRVGGPLLED